MAQQKFSTWWELHSLQFEAFVSIIFIMVTKLTQARSTSLAQTLRQQAVKDQTVQSSPSPPKYLIQKSPRASVAPYKLRARSKPQAVSPARHSQDRDETEDVYSHWRCQRTSWWAEQSAQQNALQYQPDPFIVKYIRPDTKFAGPNSLKNGIKNEFFFFVIIPLFSIPDGTESSGTRWCSLPEGNG